MTRSKLKMKMDRAFGWLPIYKGLVRMYEYAKRGHGSYHPTQFRSFGRDVKICEDVDITAPDRMCVGNGVFIGPGCLISAVGGIYVGNYAGIGARSVIFSMEHRHYGAEAIPFDDVRMVKPVWIEDYVWIGINASILPGVRIGEGAIVGLGSVVTRDVEPLSIVMGNPARVIGNRDQNAFERLKSEGRARPPSLSAKLLWIPPLTRRKYSNELEILGFDSNNMEGIFTDPRQET